MVLKRPYLIMIKYFRIIHLVLSIFSIYCIYKMNSLLKFFNDYLINDVSVVGTNLKGSLFSPLLFIFVIVLLLCSIILFFTMVNKKKPFKFYLYSTITYVLILALIIYTYSFLGQMESSLIDILVVRVLRDLFLISLLVQGIALIYFLIRLFGFDLKKFDFMSDIENYNLDSNNLDEIEVNFDFDSNERRRIRKQRFNDLKFVFRENKIVIISFLIFIFGITLYFVYTKVYLVNKTYNEGVSVNTNYYDMVVRDSYILNTSKNGIKITNNYLVVALINIKYNSYYSKFVSGNLKLHIGNNVYASTNKYDKYLSDLGNVYNDDGLSKDGNDYLFVYEISSDDINKDMKLHYYEDDYDLKIKLKPDIYKQVIKDYNINDELSVDKSSFSVNGYDIQDKMSINYELCLSSGCVSMKQNIVPNLNTNYDKTILKLIGVSKYSDDSKFKGFSQILANLGYIEYVSGGNSYISNMTRVTDLKKNEDNTYYYEINKDVMNAENIYLVINTRECKYRVILK